MTCNVKRCGRVLSGLALFSLIISVSVWAQTITSSIVGQVNDPSSAAVADARVSAKNAETGITTEGASDSSGAYTIPQLQPGIYNVTVSKAGFVTSSVTGIQVLSSQTVRVDVKLELGSVQQTVSVTGEAPLVHTDTQSITSSMTTRIINDLPKSLQSVDTLIGLVPGAATTGGNAMISGSGYWGGNDWNLNGVSIQDASNGRGTGSYGLGLITMPSTNALQEFKVASGALNAEFRNTTGITMVLKQGTNGFHGEAYAYFENKNLNANSFLNNAHGQPRPDYDRDQYGGLLGGPIKKNKLFFFGDFFHFRQVSPTIVSLTFPSAAMRQGDFSALYAQGTQLYDPKSGSPYPGNIINPASFDPIAKALMAYMPLPNLPANAAGLPNGAPNYQAAVENRYPKNNLESRVDWQISEKDSVNGFFRWSNSNPWFQASGSTPANYGNYANFRDEDFATSLTWTHSFGATAVNELRAAWHDYIQARQGQNFNLKPWTLVPSVPVQNTGGLPTVTLSGYTGISDWGAGIDFPTYDVEISDNFTKILGRHTLKAGILETGYKFSVPGSDGHLTIQLGSYNGGFGSTGSWTGGKGFPGVAASQGNSFADFLLGDLASTNYATVVNSTLLYSREWEGYVQDTWQATPRLTINYGLRYMYQSPWQERNRAYSPLDLSTSKLVLLQKGTTPVAPPTAFPSVLGAYPFETAQQAGWSTDYYIPNKTNWGPRFGFAWRPFGGSKTAIRGGYGMFYDFIGSELGTLEMTFNPPFRIGPNFATNLPGTPPAGGYLPDLTLANPFPTGGGAPASNPLVYETPRNYSNPRRQQWTLSLEQQLGREWVARASYVGAQTQHLFWYAFNINQPAVQQPNVVLQLQRPYQPWGAINYNASGGIQNFDQLQLELIKRFSSGFSLQVEYNWTRSLDDVPVAGGLNNPSCYMCDYGNSDSLPRQRLVFNYLYELPFGKGRRWLNRKGVVNAALGGWEVAGITTYVTGAPFSMAFNVPSNIVGWWGGRPDAVTGAGLYDGKNGGSHDVVSGVPWFNPAAFAPPQKWAYGNTARNNVYGPGSENWDVSLMKTFFFKGGEEGLRLQVRTDWFDAINHFNLGSPGATIGDTRDGGLPVPTAGKIFSGSGSRVIQLAVRLMF